MILTSVVALPGSITIKLVGLVKLRGNDSKDSRSLSSRIGTVKQAEVDVRGSLVIIEPARKLSVGEGLAFAM